MDLNIQDLNIRDFIEEDKEAQTRTGDEGENKDYEAIYEQLKGENDYGELKKLLLEVVKNLKNGGHVKNPEYFFRFISLLGEGDIKELLGDFNPSWIGSDIDELYKKEWFKKLLEERPIIWELTHDTSELEGGGEISKVTGGGINVIKKGLRRDNDDNNDGILEEVEVVDGDSRYKNALEDHMFFDQAGEQIDKGELLKKEEVDQMMQMCRQSGPKANAFAGPNSKAAEYVGTCMRKKGAVDGLVATATKTSNNPDDKTKRIDTLLIGNAHGAFVKLTVRIGKDRKVWRYYPETEELLDQDGNKIDKRGLKYIKFPGLAKYDSIDSIERGEPGNTINSGNPNNSRGPENKTPNDGGPEDDDNEGAINISGAPKKRTALSLSSKNFVDRINNKSNTGEITFSSGGNG